MGCHRCRFQETCWIYELVDAAEVIADDNDQAHKFHKSYCNLQQSVMNDIFEVLPTLATPAKTSLDWTTFMDKVCHRLQDVIDESWASFLVINVLGMRVNESHFGTLNIGIFPTPQALSKFVRFRLKSWIEMLQTIGSGKDRVSLDDFTPVVAKCSALR